MLSSAKKACSDRFSSQAIALKSPNSQNTASVRIFDNAKEYDFGKLQFYIKKQANPFVNCIKFYINYFVLCILLIILLFGTEKYKAFPYFKIIYLQVLINDKSAFLQMVLMFTTLKLPYQK